MERITKVVNKKSGEKFDVYIGRPSVFGNPYVAGKDGTRDEVIEKYRLYLHERIKTDAKFKAQVDGLKGLRLGCFCAPAHCHGDVLVEYLDGNLVEQKSDEKPTKASGINTESRTKKVGSSQKTTERSAGMRVLICGTRVFSDEKVIRDVLRRLPEGSVIIEGGAKGADSIAAKVAGERGLEVLEFAADWDKKGRAAGLIRNQQMLDEGDPDVIYAFYMDKTDKEKSIGTKDMVRRGIKAEVRTVEFLAVEGGYASESLCQGNRAQLASEDDPSGREEHGLRSAVTWFVKTGRTERTPGAAAVSGVSCPAGAGVRDPGPGKLSPKENQREGR
jgi:hypothetical protein